MTILFITHRINEEDDDLAFTLQWIEMFRRFGMNVIVICVEKKKFHNQFPLYCLGGADGFQKIISSLKFIWLAGTLKYDRVFMHMNPKWIILMGWYWWIKKIPTYLWYTHYTNHFSLWLSEKIIKRMFAATPQSMPKYKSSPKRIITGHGIDTNFWFQYNKNIPRYDNTHLLSVSRISASKRIHIGIKALSHLPKEYNLTIYGRILDIDDEKYLNELKVIIEELGLQDRVFWKGSVPMKELREIYPLYSIMLNMAPETIDKTVIEAMACGVFPVTTNRNAEAIGLFSAPESDSPESVARFINNIGSYSEERNKNLQSIIKKNHDLERLVKILMSYIKNGK